jgi:hypothetical protein
LSAALEQALTEHFGAQRRVATLVRHPSPYRSSFAIEVLKVVLDDGEALHIMFKDLSRDALSTRAREVKPSFLYNPLREIETYREIVAPASLGPGFYGARVDHERHRYWLFLEEVPGVELWQIGELTTWKHVAQWLAKMHSRFANTNEWRSYAHHLLHYDGDFYRRWLRRAQTFERERRTTRSEAGRGIEWLAARYEPVIECLLALPVTFIHGEFYPSNVLVTEAPRARRVCPIDWEIAAIGPGLVDLAALTAGSWDEEDRKAVALAYRAALNSDIGMPPEREAFLAALDYCRLHLAVQWMGWAAAWSPPPGRRQDWLADALRLAEELDL